jgi:hypothetical protein
VLQQYNIYVDNRQVRTRVGVLGRSAQQAVRTFKLYVYKRSFAGMHVHAVPTQVRSKTAQQVLQQVQRITHKARLRRHVATVRQDVDALRVGMQRALRVCAANSLHRQTGFAGLPACVAFSVQYNVQQVCTAAYN